MKVKTYKDYIKEGIIKESELRNLYCKDEKTIASLMKYYNCGRVVIEKCLKYFGIEKNPKHNPQEINKQNRNIISREKFNSLFIEENLTYEEISIYLDNKISAEALEHLNQCYFKCYKDKKDSIKKSIEKFKSNHNGLNPSQVDTVKKKMKDSFMDKYGVDNPSRNKDVQDKRKSTYIKKYGVNNPFSNDEIKEKIKNHYRKKYNDENIINPSQAPDLKRKISRNISISKGLLAGHDAETVSILLDQDRLKEYILSLPDEYRNYASIGKNLGYDETTIGIYCKKYKLEDIIKSKKSSSSYEEEIYQIILSLGIENIQRNSKVLDNYEIDIYLPDYKFGIEFNGNYWHSENEKTMDYHQKKALMARKNGIQLFQIFEYEWLDDSLKNKIISRIKNILIPASRKIYARKCIIKEIDKETKKDFLNNNHIQGNDRAVYSYGLFYENELIEIMTFCKARFTKADWELSRLATKQETTVIGGASKLLKYFVKNVMKDKEELITYSDLAKTSGNVYRKLNFKERSIGKPSYVWYKSHKPILSRYKTQIKNEIEKMHEQGYSRIFDAGTIVWSYSNV